MKKEAKILNFNDLQTQAIRQSRGYSLIIAGAGTGKTSTLVGRLIWLITNEDIDPKNIFLLTFTNKAASEMISRLQKELGNEVDGFLAGTFHHTAALFLRKYRDQLPRPFYNIIDELDSKRLYSKILKDLGIKTKVSEVTKVISLRRNSGQVKVIKDLKESDISNIIQRYNEAKLLSRSYDFDDLLSYFYILLKNQSLIPNQAHYVLVDEYQDCNFLQIAILQELSKIHKNLCAVGDDLQSIYSWRSALPDALQNFEKSFSPCKKFFLLENYRSHPEILKVTNQISKLNPNQFQKELVSKRNAGLKPIFIHSTSIEEESKRVLKEIQSDTDIETAVLFRSRYQCSLLERRLLENKVPYILRGGLRFFQQLHIKDLVAFVRVIAYHKDFTAWCRVLELFEGIGLVKANNFALKICETDTLEGAAQIKFPDKIKESISSILRTLAAYQEPFTIIKKIYSIFYEDYLKNHFPEQHREEDLQPLLDIAKNHSDFQEFLSVTCLNEEFKGTVSKNPLVLSTVHQAKGLEWKKIIVLGISNDHWPNKKAVAEGRKEEEVRLLYVACTRAKDILIVSQIGESTMLEDLKKFLI